MVVNYQMTTTWPIIDFVFNLIVLSGMIAWLIAIWALIIAMIVMFLKNRRR